MTKEDMQQDMDKQLHEQYANNANTNLGTTLTLVAALLAALGFYGKVYIDCGTETDVSDLSFMTQACFFVLTLIAVICMEVGSSQRSDQFIVEKIRRKYYTDEEYDKTFTRGYNPKDKGFFGFLPGLFGVITYACFITYSAVFITTRAKWMEMGQTDGALTTTVVFLSSMVVYILLYTRYYLKYQNKNR